MEDITNEKVVNSQFHYECDVFPHFILIYVICQVEHPFRESFIFFF